MQSIYGWLDYISSKTTSFLDYYVYGKILFNVTEKMVKLIECTLKPIYL